jgi:hypothetical protein
LGERIDPDSTRQLLSLLRPNDPADLRSEVGSAERIVQRAWAAERLGHIGRKSRPVVEALEFQVQHPSLHPDWLVNTLDGHAAARALGRLNATESAPVLMAAFRRVDPDLARVRNPQWTNLPLAWVDWRKGMIIAALGELRSETTTQFLWNYVALSEAEARELAIPQFEDATQALLRRRLSRAEVTRLLRSGNLAVRGTAILECVDQPTRERTAALRESAPWALTLPRAKR